MIWTFREAISYSGFLLELINPSPYSFFSFLHHLVKLSRRSLVIRVTSIDAPGVQSCLILGFFPFLAASLAATFSAAFQSDLINQIFLSSWPYPFRLGSRAYPGLGPSPNRKKRPLDDLSFNICYNPPLDALNKRDSV
jgi:hypothetical protein